MGKAAQTEGCFRALLASQKVEVAEELPVNLNFGYTFANYANPEDSRWSNKFHELPFADLSFN